VLRSGKPVTESDDGVLRGRSREFKRGEQVMQRFIITLAAVALASGAVACSDDDTTSPGGETVLQAVTPPDGATEVDLSVGITMRLSGPMASGMEQYIDLHEGSVAGPLVPMTCALSDDRRTLACSPDQPLEPGTAYTIHMGAGMTDEAGRPVETETHGMAMGGEPVTGDMMGGVHGSQAAGKMGSGWRHQGDEHLGMAFTFETA
jgi:hypothetical protein